MSLFYYFKNSSNLLMTFNNHTNVYSFRQAMNLFTDGITFMNNFKDVQRILEADKSIDFSKPASDLVSKV